MSLQTLHGDCRETLRQIPDGTVQMCVTSPPYWGLRSYLPKGHPDKHREIGQEKTPEEFVATMVQVFREVRRCLHESGTLWLNIGDSYFGGGQRNQGEIESQPEWADKANRETVKRGLPNASGLKFKDLCMIPWRVALALQADGWWLRSVICWHKKSCMPESVTDRPTNSWEPIFLLAKSQTYFFDNEAVKEPSDVPELAGKLQKVSYHDASCGRMDGDIVATRAATRNQRNVWTIPEPMATLRSDLTDEQRLYVATELAKRGLL
jgi:site-specific DNA-methyltransferase (cytosine-N4-specific)